MASAAFVAANDTCHCVPVNCVISSERKREFFELLATVTGVGPK